MNELLSVEEAAHQLGIHPVQVRRLARDGLLPASKVGSRWFFGESAIRERRLEHASPGRPLSPKMAWAYLALLNIALRREEEPVNDRLLSARVYDQLSDRRARFRLRQLVDSAPPIDRWASWLRGRAEARRIWVHPGVIEELSRDPRVRVGAEDAARHAAIGIGAGVGGAVVLYVDACNVDSVISQYRGSADLEGSVLLMAIPDDLNEGLRPAPGEPVPASVALVDLLGSLDSRVRFQAVQLLDAAAERARSLLRP